MCAVAVVDGRPVVSLSYCDLKRRRSRVTEQPTQKMIATKPRCSACSTFSETSASSTGAGRYSACAS